MRLRALPAVLFACVVVSCGDSGTGPSATPTISNLVLGAVIRPSPDTALLPLTFSFSDPDCNLFNVIVVTVVNGAGAQAINPLEGVGGRCDGTASVQQSMLLPAAGVRVTVEVSVSDRKGNQSNTLSGSFVAP